MSILLTFKTYMMKIRLIISSITSAILVILAAYFGIMHDQVAKPFMIFALISVIPNTVFIAIAISRSRRWEPGDDRYRDSKEPF